MFLRKFLAARSPRFRRLPTIRGASILAVQPTILSPDVLIEEEEKIPGYNARNFYPVNPGDLLYNRYKTLTKVGWGTTSTVWLAQDTQRKWTKKNRYVTIKIAVSGFNEDSAKNERDISRSLEANPSHNGFHYVRTMLDDFKVIGPDGKHLCFVYEPMREPLWLFQERMPDGKIPLQLLKVYLRIFLKALDYLHSECHVIHTGELQGTIDITPRADHIVDLKMDNILVGFEDPLVLEEYVEKQSENPMPRKLKDGKVIYLSHNDFGPMKSYVVLPIIADFGLARSGDGSEPLRSIIQPPIFHAPEVILGTSWTYSTDIWNFGVLIWDMMEGKDLFKNIGFPQGGYVVRAHLGEMIALLGPPPKELLDREKLWSHVKWEDANLRPDDKPCRIVREYFGGPFFDSEGEFMHKDLIPKDVSLEDSVPSLEGKDKRLFLDFARKMLQ